MKKPIDKFAILFWVLAVIVAILNAWNDLTVYDGMRLLSIQGGENHLIMGALVRGIAGTIVSAAGLAGLGVLIELVDQIRWNTRP